MKINRLLICIMLLLFLTLTAVVNVNAASLKFEILSVLDSETLKEGVTYQRIDATTTNDSGTVKNQKISYVKVESGTAEIIAWSVINKTGMVGSTLKNIAKDFEAKNPGYKVLAGINGDYFFSSGSNYISTNSLVSNGDVIKYANHEKYKSIGFNNDGSGLVCVSENTVSSKYYLTIYDETGRIPLKEIILNGQNQRPGLNQTTFFYKYSSALSMDGIRCFEVSSPDAYFNEASIIVKGLITGEVTSLNNNPIISTTNSEVIELLENNPYIRIQKVMTGDNADLDNVIGVGSQPLVNGSIPTASDIGDQGLDFANARHPRSSIGWSEDGDIIIAAIDGRQSSNGMNGVSLREEASIMKGLGAHNAFNFDGGGSTELIIRNGDSFITTNSPSDGSSRKIGSAVLIVVPDVSVDLKISEVTKTAAKVDYTITPTDEVSDVVCKVIVNGKYESQSSNSFYITGLKEGEANFISTQMTYKINDVEYTNIYKTTKIYTTEVADSPSVVRVKPSNFEVEFIRTDNGFDVIVTCDDPSETLKKVYLVCNGESEIAVKDIRGYAVSYSITTSVNMEFEIKYEYNLGTVKNVSEVYEEKFAYQYINEPQDFLVNFNPNLKKKGFDVVIGYNTNGCVITKIVVKYDGKEIECVNGVATIANAEEKNYEFSVDVYYQDGGLELMKAVDGVYSYNYINRSGCTFFSIVDVLTLLISMVCTIFIIRKMNR